MDIRDLDQETENDADLGPYGDFQNNWEERLLEATEETFEFTPQEAEAFKRNMIAYLQRWQRDPMTRAIKAYVTTKRQRILEEVAVPHKAEHQEDSEHNVNVGKIYTLDEIKDFFVEG